MDILIKLWITKALWNWNYLLEEQTDKGEVLHWLTIPFYISNAQESGVRIDPNYTNVLRAFLLVSR